MANLVIKGWKGVWARYGRQMVLRVLGEARIAVACAGEGTSDGKPFISFRLAAEHIPRAKELCLPAEKMLLDVGIGFHIWDDRYVRLGAG